MDLKDYYSILELPPSATTEEVKKSFRRMALTYHPDKTADDPYASAQFAVIKEAYEVLTNPVKKNLYLQERWYAKSTGQFKTATVLNPINLLRQMIDVERAASRMASHTTNNQLLAEQLRDIFSSDAVDMLNKFGDEKINAEIIRLSLSAGKDLDHGQQLSLFAQISRIKGSESHQRELKQLLKESAMSRKWERIKIWLLLFIVTAICIVIYLVGR